MRLKNEAASAAGEARFDLYFQMFGICADLNMMAISTQ